MLVVMLASCSKTFLTSEILRQVYYDCYYNERGWGKRSELEEEDTENKRPQGRETLTPSR